MLYRQRIERINGVYEFYIESAVKGRSQKRYTIIASRSCEAVRMCVSY
jgi:hypothetical protein